MILFISLLILGPLLWILSLVLLKSWRYFWLYFLANLIVLVGYLAILSTSSLAYFGHDEYGLGRLLILVAAVMMHTLLGFFFALGFGFRQRRGRGINSMAE